MSRCERCKRAVGNASVLDEERYTPKFCWAGPSFDRDALLSCYRFAYQRATEREQRLVKALRAKNDAERAGVEHATTCRACLGANGCDTSERLWARRRETADAWGDALDALLADGDA